MNISWQNDFCRNPSIFTPREGLKRPKNVKARAPHRACKSRLFYQCTTSRALYDSTFVNFIGFRAIYGLGIDRIVFSNVLLRFMAQILIRTFTANIACDANAANQHREEMLCSGTATLQVHSRQTSGLRRSIFPTKVSSPLQTGCGFALSHWNQFPISPPCGYSLRVLYLTS